LNTKSDLEVKQIHHSPLNSSQTRRKKLKIADFKLFF
jgi:hypothetical protein